MRGARICWALVTASFVVGFLPLPAGSTAKPEHPGEPAHTWAPPAGRYEIRPPDSYVGYRILKWGWVPVRGHFTQVAGEIVFDPAVPRRSRVEVRVPMAGLESGNPDRTATLLSADFFDAARHPQMAFASERVARGPAGDWLASGRLSIAGTTRTVTVPIELHAASGDPSLVIFSTRFTIDRRDYGVLGSRWSAGRAILDHAVEIELTLAARRRQPPR